MTCGSTCRHGHVHCMMVFSFDYAKWCNVCWAEFDAFLARSPIVRGVKKPDKLRHFLDVLRGQVPDPTPFARIDRPLFPDTWYY